MQRLKLKSLLRKFFSNYLHSHYEMGEGEMTDQLDAAEISRLTNISFRGGEARAIRDKMHALFYMLSKPKQTECANPFVSER